MAHKKNRNSIYIVILITSAIWIWYRAAPPGTTTAGEIPAPKEGFLAPELTLDTLTGQSIALADFRGQPILINVWASWCAPCRAEMPAMQRVYEAYYEQGITILAVNATNQDNLNNVASFVDDHNLTFPILLDTAGEVSQAYQVYSLPTSFFVDQKGIIQEIVIGGPMSEALLRTRLENLLQEAP